jgi:stearoyl-CoA desaturase (delta-9 desaturase)
MSNSDATTAQAADDRADPPDRDHDHSDIMYPSAVPFVLVHFACLAAIWTGVTWTAVAIGVVLYWGRLFAIGAGYHRYFSHRAYATSRVFQFILAVGAQSTAQKSVLWWAAKHRHHHLHSDTPVQPSRLDLRAPPRPHRSGQDRGFRPLSGAHVAASL